MAVVVNKNELVLLSVVVVHIFSFKDEIVNL